MSDLRKEYDKYKQDKTEMIEEASFKWVSNNIVVIHEKIDRQTVKRLANQIVKFDQAFGAFKDKLPAMADQINRAEEGLQKIITGKANEQKATKLLKQLGFLYNNFSSYFNSDLPVILSTPIMRQAKANPEVKLSVLQAPGHDATSIRDAFKHSLEPSKEEAKLLKKIYRSKQPLIDTMSIANQMLNLSYNELEELTGINKVPMIATPEPEVPAKTQSDLNESAVLLEVISGDDARKLIQTMNKINNQLNVKGLEGVSSALKTLSGEAYDEFNKGTWLDKKRGVKFKQLLAFSSLLDSMKGKWNQVKSFFGDDVLDEATLLRIRETLEGAAKDSQGFFGKIKSFVTGASPHASGLEPDTVIDGIMNVLSQKDAEGKSLGIKPIENLFNSFQELESPEEMQKDASEVGPVDKTPVDKTQELLSVLQDKGFKPSGTGDTAVAELLGILKTAGIKP